MPSSVVSNKDNSSQFSPAANDISFKIPTTKAYKKQVSSNDFYYGNLPDEYYYDQNPDVYKLFIEPKYIKVSHKQKIKSATLKKLFLAQELDTTGSNSISNDVSYVKSTSDSIISGTSGGIKSSQSIVGAGLSSIRSSIDESTSIHNSLHRTTTNDENGHAIWCLKFSHDGKFLAAAGKDSIIRIYKVIISPLDRLDYEHEKIEDDLHRRTFSSIGPPQEYGENDIDKNHGKNKKKEMLYAPLFHDTPYKEFVGHNQDILSLDWSKNNFLLSSSMDHTVRLWHVDRDECLEVYKHSDFVTCAKFHPTDDRFFVSGSLDKKIRLWSILENQISYQAEVSSMITACEFYPNGDKVLVGTINGVVFVFDTKGLHPRFNFDLKKNYIKNSSAAKISGLECFEVPVSQGGTDVRVLITTNDSRVRLYSCTNPRLLEKFKGLLNKSSQAMAVTSNSRDTVLSASEDHMIYLWQVNDLDLLEKAKKNKSLGLFKNSHNNSNNSNKNKSKIGDLDLSDNIKNESFLNFQAHNSIVTGAVFAPIRTKKLLYLSNDPIYDLNRTYLDILNNDHTGGNDESFSFEKPVFKVSDYIPPSFYEDPDSVVTVPSKYGSSKIDSDTIMSLIDPLQFHIIVSADDKGKIRVFRIDSASQIRKILQKRLFSEKSDKKLHHHHHHHHRNGSSGTCCLNDIDMEPFLKRLNGLESYLVNNKLNSLTLNDNGEITNYSKPEKASKKNTSKCRKSKSSSIDHNEDQRHFTPSNSFLGNSGIEIPVTQRKINQEDSKSNGNTLKDLISQQNQMIYSDIKNEQFQQPNHPPPLKKNGSIYSLSNSSISSLLRGRSGSNRNQEDSNNYDSGNDLMCEVCQGTKFLKKKIQYKGSNNLVKVCEDCGNQVK